MIKKCRKSILVLNFWLFKQKIYIVVSRCFLY